MKKGDDQSGKICLFVPNYLTEKSPETARNGWKNTFVLPAECEKTQQKRPTQKRASPLISMAERVGFEPTVAINHT